MAEQVNPLTEEHYELLNKVCQSCTVTEELAGKCKRCGIEVDELLEKNRAQKQMAEQIKKEFFPLRS